jgi:hypothetical protein
MLWLSRRGPGGVTPKNGTPCGLASKLAPDVTIGTRGGCAAAVARLWALRRGARRTLVRRRALQLFSIANRVPYLALTKDPSGAKAVARIHYRNMPMIAAGHTSSTMSSRSLFPVGPPPSPQPRPRRHLVDRPLRRIRNVSGTCGLTGAGLIDAILVFPGD